MVLVGGQGTGKTEFFRRLLPKELKKYHADSKLDNGKDDELLMTEKLLISDDEFGGKNKTEGKRFKELTSRDTFDLRKAYDRQNRTYKRLAVLCGTSNELDILTDDSGNRRTIPIEISAKIDRDIYNSIDKKALLLEVYHLYKSGERHTLEDDETALLNEQTDKKHKQISSEAELVLKYFKKAEDKTEYLERIENLTTTDI